MHSIDNAFFNRFLKHVPSTVHSVHIPSTPNTVFNAFLTTCVLCSSLCDGRFARSPLLRGRVESVVLLHGRRRDRRFAAGVRGARVHDGQVMSRCVCPCVDVGCGLWVVGIVGVNCVLVVHMIVPLVVSLGVDVIVSLAIPCIVSLVVPFIVSLVVPLLCVLVPSLLYKISSQTHHTPSVFLCTHHEPINSPHSPLPLSGIAPLEADFKGPNTTAEGDYVVLSLQTARFLLKSVDAARAKEALPGTMFVLFMMVLPVVYIPVPIVIYTCMLGPLGVVGSIRDCVLVCFGVFFC